MTHAPPSTRESAEFDRLQRQLAPRFKRFRADPTQPYTAVVVPSQSLDPRELEKIPGVEHYEERSLFNLMLLRRPRMKVVYVTSKALDPLIVDYYLHQMRGVPTEHARRRLVLLNCDDARPVPLAQKILERPRLVQRIREAIADDSMAHLAPFNASPLERSLALALQIPMVGCDPSLVSLGTKSGSRHAFRAAHIEMPPGREDLRSVDDLVAAIVDLRLEHPDARRVVVKLEDGFSGEGNAILELAGVEPTRSSVERALPKLRFEAVGLTWPEYAEQFEAMGGICELWLDGEHKVSPSAQLRVTPLMEVQPVSTHDQVLGGRHGQVYQGATFPAHSDYRLEIQARAIEVGKVLARRGVIGRFGVDFVVVREPDGDKIYAIEINLRQGGTTHPFNTLRSLTDGAYDAERGVFLTAQGRERCYFATDTLERARYRGLLPFDLIDMLVNEQLHFGANETGAVFHLLGCLSQYGKLGGTFIAEDLDGAKELYRRTVAMLDRETVDA